MADMKKGKEKKSEENGDEEVKSFSYFFRDGNIWISVLSHYYVHICT